MNKILTIPESTFSFAPDVCVIWKKRLRGAQPENLVPTSGGPLQSVQM